MTHTFNTCENEKRTVTVWFTGTWYTADKTGYDLDFEKPVLENLTEWRQACEYWKNACTFDAVKDEHGNLHLGLEHTPADEKLTFARWLFNWYEHFVTKYESLDGTRTLAFKGQVNWQVSTYDEHGNCYKEHANWKVFNWYFDFNLLDDDCFNLKKDGKLNTSALFWLDFLDALTPVLEQNNLRGF